MMKFNQGCVNMNIFVQFFKSLYSPKDIAMVRFQGIGKTITYVFFLTFLSIIPAIYYLSSAAINGTDALQDSIENDFPAFQITNGELQTIDNENEKEAPIIINKRNFTVIFDSTGAVKSNELPKNKNAIAILKNDAFFITSGQVLSLPYSMFNDFTITDEDILSFLTSFNSSSMIILPLYALVVYIFAAGMKFIEISILALFGLLLNKMLMRTIQYRHSWRMAAYSITLPTLFFIIMDGLKTTVPNGAIINWFVGLIILYLTIKEIPQPKKK